VTRLSTILKEIAGVAFATPAALGLIAKIDKRIELYPLLERAVLGYDRLIEYAVAFVHRFIVIDWLHAETILFSTFLTIQIVVNRFIFGNPTANSQLERTVWSIASTLSCIIFLFVFGAFTGFEAGLNLGFFLGVAMAGMVYILLFFFSLSTKFFSDLHSQKLPWSYAYIAVCFIVGSVLSSDTIIEAFKEYGVVEALISLSFILYIFILIRFIEKSGIKSPAYILIWSMGIIFVNWLAVSFKPTVEEFLGVVGA